MSNLEFYGLFGFFFVVVALFLFAILWGGDDLDCNRGYTTARIESHERVLVGKIYMDGIVTRRICVPDK